MRARKGRSNQIGLHNLTIFMNILVIASHTRYKLQKKGLTFHLMRDPVRLTSVYGSENTPMEPAAESAKKTKTARFIHGEFVIVGNFLLILI